MREGQRGLELEVDRAAVLVHAGIGFLAAAGNLGGESNSEGISELVLDGESDRLVGSADLGLEGGLGIELLLDGQREGRDLQALTVHDGDGDLTSRIDLVLLVEEGSRASLTLGGLVESGHQFELLGGSIAELQTIAVQRVLLLALDNRGHQSRDTSADSSLSKSDGRVDGDDALGVGERFLGGDVALLVEQGDLVGLLLAFRGTSALRVQGNLQTSDLGGLVGGLQAVDGGILLGLAGGLGGEALAKDLGDLEQGVQSGAGVGTSGLELLHSLNLVKQCVEQRNKPTKVVQHRQRRESRTYKHTQCQTRFSIGVTTGLYAPDIC